MKKYICFLVQEYYPKDPRVRKYVDLLLSNGYRVDVISLKKNGFKSYENSDNLEIYRIGIPKKRSSLLRYFIEYAYFFISSLYLISVLYLKKRYSIIHVNNLPDFLVFSTIIPKLLGSKIILDMHEVAPEFFQMKYNKNEDFLLIKLLKVIEKYSLQYCDFAITINKAITKLLTKRSISNRKIDIIMNVPDKRINKIMDFNKYDKHFNIVYHGTISDLYSLQNSILSISLLKEEIPLIRFHIYGEGPSENKLKKLVEERELSDNVHFHGYIDNRYICDELKKMNVGMLPLERNVFIDLSFSNKLTEYIAQGLPVIISEIPSIMDYFSSNSLFYCKTNPEEIKKQILRIYHNNDLVKDKIRNSQKEYKKIDWNIMSKKYLSIISKLGNNTCN